MKIDGNELAILQNELDQQGKNRKHGKSSRNFCSRCARRATIAPALRLARTMATALSA